MITVVETKSGSTYEVDRDAKRIRRVSTAKGARWSPGGEGWQTYAEIYIPAPEAHVERMIISWPNTTNDTITSEVVRVAARVEQRCSA